MTATARIAGRQLAARSGGAGRIWRARCVGTRRTVRPLLDSARGDRDAGTDMILEDIVTTTDANILALIDLQRRNRVMHLQDNRLSLLRHMQTLDPAQLHNC